MSSSSPPATKSSSSTASVPPPPSPPPTSSPAATSPPSTTAPRPNPQIQRATKTATSTASPPSARRSRRAGSCSRGTTRRGDCLNCRRKIARREDGRSMGARSSSPRGSSLRAGVRIPVCFHSHYGSSPPRSLMAQAYYEQLIDTANQTHSSPSLAG